MKALHSGTRSQAFQAEYHLRRNDAPEFDAGQPGRIDLARMFVEKMLVKDLTARPIRIVELGCGAGDISGPYSGEKVYSTPRGTIDTGGIEVVGVDFVPVAKETCARRFPEMKFILAPVEDVEPIDSDLLIMCEFLEHVADPLTITRQWMAKSRFALIGHPLNEPDPPFEHGHCWSYSFDDWHNWFRHNNYNIWERVLFPMGFYEMVLGHGSKQ